MDSKNSRAFLIDFDNVVFETEKLKKLIESKFKKVYKNKISVKDFWSIYEKNIEKYGYNNIKGLPKKLRSFFTDANFPKALFPNSIKILDELKESGKLILYTLGDKDFQKLKISKSGVEEAVGKNNVFITQDKHKELKILLSRCKNYKYIFFIDDRAEFLETAKKLNKNVITIWFRYGKYKNIKPKNNKLIDFETSDLKEAKRICTSFISKIDSNLNIIRSISEENIRQIIERTSKDKEIKKYTHDTTRFENIKSFKEWHKKGKDIYTLMDKSGKLAGLIWFSKKEYQKYETTFAIRIYGKFRGKKLAYPFAKEVIKRLNYKDIWLETKNDNLPALKLYKNIGFKKVEETDKAIFMVLN